MKPEIKKLMDEVSDNPASIKWPRDKWGFTTDMKKHILRAAGSTSQNAEKHDLLLATLAVAIAHVQKRRAKDVRVYEARKQSSAAAAEDRVPRQRVSAALVASTDGEA